ncbi:AAA family ATPase [Mesorhizobium sp.]|uniref:AAA family ATPase n=1 Tax=Mesorhizobium sp. TaxID=1871066 RepID=UPI0025C638FA|nr:AAA family ATPase [Mesorhizobium sp.]
MSKPEPLKILSYADMKDLPEPAWLIDGLIQENTTALMFGKSNSFKSFLAIDIALSVASHRPWHSHEVLPDFDNSHALPTVLIVATEGGNGVGRKRIPAWYDHHNVPEAERTAFLYPREIRLDVADDVTALIDAVDKAEFSQHPMSYYPAFQLIVIDIFGGSMAGSEIEDKTARAWVHGIQRILRETGVAVLVVAHAPYQDDSRIRGHSHFWGSFDTRLKVEGDKGAMTATLTVERHKDADSAGSWGFRLTPSGGSLVPEMDSTITAARKQSLSPKNRAALIALDDALQASGVRKFGQDWPPCNVVQVEQWRHHFYLHSHEDAPDTKRQAFNQAKNFLRDGGHIQFYDDHVWRCFDGKAAA